MAKPNEPGKRVGPQERIAKSEDKIGHNAPERPEYPLPTAREQGPHPDRVFKHFPKSGKPIYHRLWHYPHSGEKITDTKGFRPCKQCRPDLA